MNRIYIFTGKGGVGKSSVASAHAMKSAEEGKKTLLASTDMAHNLGDIFEVTLQKEPMEVLPHLDIYEIDPNYVMEQDFSDFLECMGKMIPDMDADSMEKYGMIPGMEELFSLLKIAKLYHSGIYENIIVDCAPTGETLSLLKFPELLSWYMEKLFPLGRVAVRVLSPFSKKLFDVEMPNKKAMNDIEKLYVKLSELQELLRNREITSVRLVTLPEKMVVEETKRNYMYMNLYNFHVDGLYINRILPEDIGNRFFEQWQELQKKYITELQDCFRALPIYYIPWYEEELKGSEAIGRICRDVLVGDEVFQTKTISEREHFEKNEEGYVLTVSLPYAKKEELDLYQSGTDVIIRLNQWKRSIPLPTVLRKSQIAGAELKEGLLTIQFAQVQEGDSEK